MLFYIFIFTTFITALKDYIVIFKGMGDLEGGDNDMVRGESVIREGKESVIGKEKESVIKGEIEKGSETGKEIGKGSDKEASGSIPHSPSPNTPSPYNHSPSPYNHSPSPYNPSPLYNSPYQDLKNFHKIKKHLKNFEKIKKKLLNGYMVSIEQETVQNLSKDPEIEIVEEDTEVSINGYTTVTEDTWVIKNKKLPLINGRLIRYFLNGRRKGSDIEKGRENRKNRQDGKGNGGKGRDDVTQNLSGTRSDPPGTRSDPSKIQDPSQIRNSPQKKSTPVPESFNSPVPEGFNSFKKLEDFLRHWGENPFQIQNDAPWGLSNLVGLDNQYVYLKDAGHNTLVYVLDTGVDVNHPEFGSGWGGETVREYEGVSGNGTVTEGVSGNGTVTEGVSGNGTVTVREGDRRTVREGESYNNGNEDYNGNNESYSNSNNYSSNNKSYYYNYSNNDLSRAEWGYNATGDGIEMDMNGHGTHCAGIIAGNTVGIARKAKIIAVKVLDGEGKGMMSSIIDGIRYVIGDHKKRYEMDNDQRDNRNKPDNYQRDNRNKPDNYQRDNRNKPDNDQRDNDKKDSYYSGNKKNLNKKNKTIINLSVGGSKSPALNHVIKYTSKHFGIHFAIAAGNDGADACEYSPGSSKLSLTTGAIGKEGKVAVFSNVGTCVDIYAPGVEILSAWPGFDYKVLSGTSMATPHVAGVMAVYLTYEKYKVKELMERIEGDAEREGERGEVKGKEENMKSMTGERDKNVAVTKESMAKVKKESMAKKESVAKKEKAISIVSLKKLYERMTH